MRRLPRTVVLAAAAVLLINLATGQARASLIFSNLGPADDYQTNIGWAVQGANISPGRYDRAMQFVPTGGDQALGQIELAIGGLSRLSPPVTLDVTLAMDDQGLPGAAIEHFTFDFAALRTVPTGLLVAASKLNPVLQSGTRYWLVAEANDADLNAIWFWNSTGGIGRVGQRIDLGSWTANDQQQGAFRLTAVPGPSNWALLGVGAVATAGLNWVSKRKKPRVGLAG